MSISDFWLSVLASIIASILVALAAKITLEKWKQVAMGLGATAVVALVISFIVFAGITVTKEFSAYLERSSLQSKIATYVKGHYPDEVKRGYGVDVLEIRQRVFLGFRYPGAEGYPSLHPFRNEEFGAEIVKLLNDNGYPGTPIWGYPLKPASAEQMEKLFQQK
jgi:hypothetical protein